MNSWTSRVEWDTTDPYDDDALDAIMEQLASHSPAIAHEDGDTWSATITIHTSTLRQAIARSLEAVEVAVRQRTNGIEVLREVTFDRRVAHPSIPELWGHAETAEHLGVTRQRAAQLADEHDTFPPAVVVTKAGPLRVRSQVEAWARTWERKTGRPKSGGVLVAIQNVDGRE